MREFRATVEQLRRLADALDAVGLKPWADSVLGDARAYTEMKSRAAVRCAATNDNGRSDHAF